MLAKAAQQEWEPLTLDWSGELLQASFQDRDYTSPWVLDSDDRRDQYASLAALARRLRKEQIELRGCANCARFRFSGMSRQMSGCTLGYCTLVGFRSRSALVRLDHGCGQHRAVAGWPDDLNAAHEHRLALSDEDPRPHRRQAFQGAVLGLAIGDALGFPAEFRNREQILASFGPEGLTDFLAVDDPRWPATPLVVGKRHPPGTYSDDTQMSLAVADALIEAGQKDLEELMQRMADAFVRWSRSPDNDRAPGGTCMEGCRRLEAGVSWREAGVVESKGCGSAMRVAPIGLYYWRDRARLLEVARASSLLTHGHPAAVQSAAAAALLVAMALEKRTPQSMYEALMNECAPGSEDFRECLLKVPAMIDADPAVVLSEQGLGEGWVAEQAVASALYCFWRSPQDVRRMLQTAINTDGDSDSIASIAGSIGGAFNGVGSLPGSWLQGVENSVGLTKLADKLWEAWPRGAR